MKDRDYLMWLHERLEHVHGESPLVDYMHKLRAIIKATPTKRETPNCGSANSLEALKAELSNDGDLRHLPASKTQPEEPNGP